MLKAFHEFLSAVAEETNTHFTDCGEGSYIGAVEFDSGQSQKVLIELNQDEAGDSQVSYYSLVLKEGSWSNNSANDLFESLLSINSSLSYGALALFDGDIILRNATFIKDLDPERFIKSFYYVAAKANELSEELQGSKLKAAQ